MLILIESLFGLLLAVTFGSRLLFPGGGMDAVFTKWVRKPLKNLASGRVGRMMDDRLFSWAVFILGLWIALPDPLIWDKWPALLLVFATLLALARAGKSPQVTYDVEGTAVDMTPKSAAKEASPQGDKHKTAA
jgi:hypothetical protein